MAGYDDKVDRSPERNNVKIATAAVDENINNNTILEVRKTTKIEREKTCPFLLRCFIKVNSHHSLIDYSMSRVPTNETCIHTWKDATLREIMSLLGERQPEMNSRHARITIMQIFKSQRDGAFSSKHVGTVSNHRKTADEDKTLESLRIVVGDYFDIALFNNQDDDGSNTTRAVGINETQIVERSVPPSRRPDFERFSERNGFGRGVDRFHPYPRPSDGNWKRDQIRNDRDSNREGRSALPPLARRDSFSERDTRDHKDIKDTRGGYGGSRGGGRYGW